MRRFEIKEFGLDNLKLVDAPDPEPGPGEVVVRVNAVSLNYRDLLIVQGFYRPEVPLPRIPLSDGAGEVVAVGQGVDKLQVGDRVTSVFWQTWPDGPISLPAVAASTGCEAAGMAAELAVLPAAAVLPIPDAMSYEAAASLPCAAVTAWHALTSAAGISAGDTVLTMGTGGVSLFALQFAKALGAEVIITSSSDEKLARAKTLGADHGINYKSNPDWGKAAFDIAGSGVGAVIETGGVGTLGQSIDAIGWNGTITFIGVLAGMSGDAELMGILAKAAALKGVLVGSRAEHAAMLDFMTTQAIEPVIDRHYPLEELPQALGDMAGGQHFGKIVLTVA